VDDLKPEYAAEIKSLLQRAKAQSGQGGQASRDTSRHGAREASGTPTAELLNAANGTNSASAGSVPAGAAVEVLGDGSEHSASQFRAFELQEECGSWFLLARQAVVDVMFLDSNQLECQAKLHMSTSTTTVSSGEFCCKLDRFCDSFYCFTSVGIALKTEGHILFILKPMLALSLY
jgi:hypothetical protein